jgi:hypothetical protein
MTINEGIDVLKAAREMFGGDTNVTFLAPEKPGEKATLHLENVDSAAHMNRFFPETGFDENRLSSQN